MKLTGPQILGAAFGWSALVLIIAFLTPPGRFLIWLYMTMRTEGSVNTEMPVAALRVWFALVPALAFGPPAVALIAWLRRQGVS